MTCGQSMNILVRSPASQARQRLTRGTTIVFEADAGNRSRISLSAWPELGEIPSSVPKLETSDSAGFANDNDREFARHWRPPWDDFSKLTHPKGAG